MIPNSISHHLFAASLTPREPGPVIKHPTPGVESDGPKQPPGRPSARQFRAPDIHPIADHELAWSGWQHNMI